MKLSFGLPKGSLEESTIALFKKAGIHIRKGERSYFPACDDTDLDLILMRPQEIPRYVEEGVLDAGITGQDWTKENRARVVEVAQMQYSKATRTKCKWVLAVPESSPFMKPEDLKGKRIATELVQVTKDYFSKKKIPVKVEFSWGATEVKPPRLVDAIVDITETGSSLRANRLRIIDVLMETTSVIIANRTAWKHPEKRSKLENMTMLLQGTLEAENYMGLKCNVKSADLDKVLKILPALHNPTVSSLSDKGWYAVETFVHFQETRQIIPRLKRAGASGIVEYPVSKVIP
ncbi:MAG: ATP phosphoribosyltransferase [Chitinispirillaceae bacterium]|jgi:ATP phosphoribosyltransferase|nr:ATP phosphoribosyltransferase [Chitinispirillaceae bacterium]